MSVATQIPKSIDSRALSPVISTRYALTWQHAVVVTCFGASFLLINHLPVSLHSVWRHANHGNWILEHQALPKALPNALYADGMPYVASSWLSDLLVAWGIRQFGLESISAAMAVLTTLSMGLWSWLNYRQAQQKRYVLLTAASLMVVWSFGFSALRPQVIAGTLFPALLWLVWPNARSADGRAESRDERLTGGDIARGTAAIALLVLWANLDVTVLLGVATLSCLAFGEFAKAWGARANEKLGTRLVQSLRLPQVQRTILFAELGAAATLLNPRGGEIWLSLVQANTLGPLWSVAGGDYGLELATPTGLFFGLLVTFVIVAWQLSRIEKRAIDICLFGIAVIATALNGQNIYWLAPIVLFLAARHWPEIAARFRWQSTDRNPSDEQRSDEQRSDQEYHPLLFAWSLICGLLVWCTFSFSPISAPLLSATRRPVERILDQSVPLDVAEFLNKEADGIVWAPSDWSDWLAWSSHHHATRPEISMFVNSRVAQFPAAIQRDYSRIFRADDEWDNLTRQYKVETLVIDKSRQSKLSKDVVRSGRWRLVLETDQSMVLFLNEA